MGQHPEEVARVQSVDSHSLSQGFSGSIQVSQTSPGMESDSSKTSRDQWKSKEVTSRKHGRLGSRSLPLLFCLLNFTTTPIMTEKRLSNNLLQWRLKGKIKFNKEKFKICVSSCLSLRTASTL